MTEMQGKSILVRVSARFELARVRVVGSRLYLHTGYTAKQSVFLRTQVRASSQTKCLERG